MRVYLDGKTSNTYMPRPFIVDPEVTGFSICNSPDEVDWGEFAVIHEHNMDYRGLLAKFKDMSEAALKFWDNYVGSLFYTTGPSRI